MAFLDDLKTRRDSIAAELALITTSKTTHSIDGHSMQHDQHRVSLLTELKLLNDQITVLDAGEVISFIDPV